jgi:hypothetical protein
MSYIVPKEKPKCFNCPFRTLDYCGLLTEHDSVTVNVNEMSVSDYCPLVEIPTPHGRLIDADALHDAMYHRAFETDGDTMWQSGCWVRYRAIEQVHESQPIIIKAEGETDGR